MSHTFWLLNFQRLLIFRTEVDYLIISSCCWFFHSQSYGIKVGYGGIPGPSGGRDGSSSQGGGCCSWDSFVNPRYHSLSLCILVCTFVLWYHLDCTFKDTCGCVSKAYIFFYSIELKTTARLWFLLPSFFEFVQM